ncbi:MAG: hypothetical protein WCQ96_02800 [Patescibacteria group bacterium]
MAKKELEGAYEKYLLLFMPIWLTLVAIKKMRREIAEEKRKKAERGM